MTRAGVGFDWHQRFPSLDSGSPDVVMVVTVRASMDKSTVDSYRRRSLPAWNCHQMTPDQLLRSKSLLHPSENSVTDEEEKWRKYYGGQACEGN